jgi:site-specific recombinase XerD
MEDITTEAIKVLLSMPDTTTRRGLRDYALFSLMYCTATRIDEVLSLTISSINTDGRGNYHLTVHGKGNKVRTIPLLKKENDVVKNYIRVFHVDTPKEGDLLFYVQRNGQKEKLTQSAVSKRLKLYVREAAKICDDVPVTLHCHSLRHARATHWLEQGVGLAIIQKLLGHENINTTMIYVGVSIKQKSKALETLEDEDTRSMPKKWKSLKKGNSLTEFLGLE